MPLVSVLITSYNHEKWLAQCLDSALSQTYLNREIIVVDDGSSDGSQQILKSYGDQITLIENNPNIGTYPSLNKALSFAKGEYVAILNSDDYWDPKKLELQVDLMQKNSSLVFCHTFGDFVDANGETITGTPMGFEFPRTPTGDCFSIFVANNTAIASSVLAKTDAVQSVGGFDGTFKNLGDWDLWLKLSEIGGVGFVDEKLTFYRIHGSNTIHGVETTRAENLRVRQAMREKQSSIIARRPQMKPAVAHTLACLGSLYSLKGNTREARKCYVEAAKLMPLRIKTYLRYLLTFAPAKLREKLI